MSQIKCTCLVCQKVFYLSQGRINEGRGRFCSRSCAHSGKYNSSYKHGNSTRGHGATKEYRAWANIKQRTTNPKADNAKYYSARGIAMCERWLNSFENFLEDMGPAPSKRHSVDRIDNTNGYEPGNCRWATAQEQMVNSTRAHLVTYNGTTMHLEAWGKLYGVSGIVLSGRLRMGWTVERALTTPIQKHRSRKKSKTFPAGHPRKV